MEEVMKILVSDDVSEKGVELLRQNGYTVDVETNLDEDQLAERIGEYDGLITRSMTHVTAKVIEKAKKLKIVGRAGVGIDSIDLKAATARGIIVVNAPTSNTIAATEHTCAIRRWGLSVSVVSDRALPNGCRLWKCGPSVMTRTFLKNGASSLTVNSSTWIRFYANRITLRCIHLLRRKHAA